MTQITEEYLKSIATRLTPYKSEVRICCPFCTDDNFHMYVNTNKKVYHCHKCEASGKMKDVMTMDDAINFSKKIGDILSSTPVTIKVPLMYETKPTDLKKIRTLPHSSQIWKEKLYYQQAQNYLLGRGIDSSLQRELDIKVSKETSGIYKNTVIFPIYELNKDEDDADLKYFVCRRYDKTEPKYINAPWPKEDTLFQFGDNQYKTPFNAIIVEGIFDAIAIGQSGYNAIALLGKKATGQQLNRLDKPNRDGSRPCFGIYLDHDAFTHAIELKLQFSAMGITSTIIQCKQDASEVYNSNPNDLRELLDNARLHQERKL